MGMLKPATPKGLQDLEGPEDPRWLHVRSGTVGKAISGERGLGTRQGRCSQPPARLWTPTQSCRPPSRAMTPMRGREPHGPPEKAVIATRWQAEPSIPAQATTPGRKTQPWGNNPRPLASLCSRSPPGHPPGEPSTGPHLLASWSKGIRHLENLVVSAFSRQFKKRSSLAHTRAEDADPQHLFLEAGGLSQHHSVLWMFPPHHGPL